MERPDERMERLEREDDYYESRAPPPVTAAHTLGRYQKHGQRFSGSTPNLHQQQQDYRSAQTLPRKLHEQRTQRFGNAMEKQPPPGRGSYLPAPGQQHQQQQQPRGIPQNHNQSLSPNPSGNPNPNPNPNAMQPQGPAKPARTYAKVLNRSKSFNVHGMNGSNDPSPIYIEKLTRNNYQPRQEPTFGYGLGQGPNANYKSNPHLFSGKDNSLKGGLKSPSIVNLISRSQKDLTKIAGCDEDDGGGYPEQDKKQLYLRGLHQQAPDLYRVIHGDEEYGGSRKYPLQAKYSLDSRSPPSVELNKDTASIVRRGSEVEHLHHQQQQQHHHHHHIQSHQQQNLRRGSGATIIELRTAAGGHRK